MTTGAPPVGTDNGLTVRPRRASAPLAAKEAVQRFGWTASEHVLKLVDGAGMSVSAALLERRIVSGWPSTK
jgi:hypothetical protein